MAEVKKRAPKKVTVDYNKGKIYKIVSDVNDIVYIGSTTQELSKRMVVHKAYSKVRSSKFYTAMREIGCDHFRIILVENYPCKSKEELEAREYEVMKSFPRDQTYNSIIDGKHCEETKQKMRELHTGLKASEETKQKMREAQLGRLNPGFQRGSLSCQPERNCFRFKWQVDGKQEGKTFSFGSKSNRTREQAYLACIDKQNEIFPLTHEEYMSELPFSQ